MKQQLLLFLLLTLVILKDAPLTCMEIINNNNNNDDDSSTELISQNKIQSSSQKQKNPHLTSYIHTYATYADQGVYRKTMEDFYSNLPEYGFHGVYDGHGGDTFGKFAQIKLAAYIFTHEDFETKPHDAIKNGFLSFNEKYSNIRESGTTATVLIFKNKSFIIGNVGDSHAVLYSSNGKAAQLTENHHPSDPEEAKRIADLAIKRKEKVTFTDYFQDTCFPIIASWKNNTPEIGVRTLTSITRVGSLYGSRVAVSRALGDFFAHPYLIPEPFIQEISLEKSHEFIIIASDGLWDAISKEAAGDFVREKMNEINKNSSTINPEEAQKIAEALVRTALKCHDRDNVTATIIFLNNS